MFCALTLTHITHHSLDLSLKLSAHNITHYYDPSHRPERTDQSCHGSDVALMCTNAIACASAESHSSDRRVIGESDQSDRRAANESRGE